MANDQFSAKITSIRQHKHGHSGKLEFVLVTMRNPENNQSHICRCRELNLGSPAGADSEGVPGGPPPPPCQITRQL